MELVRPPCVRCAWCGMEIPKLEIWQRYKVLKSLLKWFEILLLVGEKISENVTSINSFSHHE